MTISTAKLFTNGKIFTSKKGDDGLCQSMLVHNGKVLYVGDDKWTSQVAQEVCSVSAPLSC